MILLVTSVSARGEEWTLISTDDSSQTFLSYEKIIKEDSKKRFRVKSIFKNYRDLMGLQYNSTINSYVISCELDLVRMTHLRGKREMPD